MIFERHSEPLDLSLSELVWIALMVLLLIFGFSQNKARKEYEDQRAEILRLTTDNDRLKRENKVFTDGEKTLRQEINKDKNLQDENTTLQEHINALVSEKAQLQERYEVLKQLLARGNNSKAKILDNLEKEKIICKNLMASNLELEKKVSALNDRITRLENENQSLQALWDDSKERLTDTKDENKDLNAQIKKLKESIEDMQKEFLLLSRDMIDIKGKLNRVICIVDCSSSMVSNENWDVTKKLIKTWISHLDIKELMLITYNETVVLHTDTFLDVAKDHPGQLNENLQNVVSYLDKIIPQSYSDTYSALEEAYKHAPDTIFLFTDGAPNRHRDGIVDEHEMQRIITGLIEEHRGIPINIIGFGNYFDERIGNYFTKVIELTDGTFIGR